MLRATLFPALLLPVIAPAASVPLPSANPLLAPSSLEYAYPPFDRIRDEHFGAAFEQGMTEQLREVEAILSAPAAPTFANTLVALERSGETLSRARSVFFNLAGAHGNDRTRALERQLAPRLAAHADAIRLDPRLFARVDRLFADRAQLGLDPESLRLLEKSHADLVRAGARLAEPEKVRLRALNAEISSLQTTFTQNVLKEVNASLVWVDRAEDLDGLTPAEVAAAAELARAEGRPGAWALRLLNTSGQPVLASLRNRALRERIHQASLVRGSRGGEFDNLAVVSRLARLRAERARLLGYPNHATYVLEDQTARTPQAVNRLLADLGPAAVANARREAAAMQAIIDREGGGFTLAAWDWPFYGEKERRERFAFDEAELKPYLEAERVLRDGVFFAAEKLFGLTFRARPDLPVYEETVRAYEILDADGRPLAAFLLDLYARPSKRGGAWMNSYVDQSRLLGSRPVVGNHLNVSRPVAGEPTLLTFDQVVTLFHEFGHALHGLFSAVEYPRFSGTKVPRDFVEFPSQVYEMWATWPEVLRHYARHHRTGEPLPEALVGKVIAAGKFHQGYRTTEYLAAAVLDQAWHQLAPEEVPGPEGVLAFEAAVLRRAGLDFAAVPPRYRTPYFSHVFSSGYSAGYYSYLWAEVLDADAVEWFRANGGLTRANGDRLRRTVLSRGGSADAMQLYRDFRGAEPELRPLLQRRGLEPRAEPAR
ncbi:MAG: M3 family metallopeptidase [Verrucomicrobia bacterium]|nr:M3 family metallopeptidase [Verrucomicrobiota bacterium]